MPSRSTIERRRMKAEEPERYALLLAQRREKLRENPELRELKNQKTREWRKANPQKVRELNAARYLHDPEKMRAYSKAYYHANKQKCADFHKEWQNRPHVVEKRKEKWRKIKAEKAEKVRMWQTKSGIARRMGIRAENVPDELVELHILKVDIEKTLRGKGVKCPRY